VSDREVESSLRLLAQAGAVQELGGDAAHVQLLWSPAEVTARLGTGDGLPLRVLRALWRAVGARLAHGAVVSLDALPDLPGGRADAEPVLDALARDGGVIWRRLDAAGWSCRSAARPLDQYPVDWDGLERRRRAANDQLDAVQRYAYADRCRRAFVLRYFGDPAARGMTTCGSCDVCLGEARPFRVHDAAPAPRPKRAAEAPAALTPDEQSRFDALRVWRAALAKEARVPAYVVLPDRTLKALAVEPPATLQGLANIPGIGPAKLDRYGASLMATLAALP
jgi:ATP-dependent DNA helicase RecQ